MIRSRYWLAGLTAIALCGVAGQALAQTAHTPAAGATVTAARDTFTLNQSQKPQVLETDGPQRWGLKLEIRQPVTRPTDLRDVEAGVSYKLTPSIRLGGALGVTDAAAEPAVPAPNQTAPRVRLGASFKF